MNIKLNKFAEFYYGNKANVFWGIEYIVELLNLLIF